MVKFYYTDEKFRPLKVHNNDAGYDLLSMKHIEIPKFHTVKIPTGVRAEISVGFFGLILPRSSIRSQGILIDGVIDSDYRGEIHMIATNISLRKKVITVGARIGQIIIVPFLNSEMVRYMVGTPQTTTSRGENGFGSTGGVI